VVCVKRERLTKVDILVLGRVFAAEAAGSRGIQSTSRAVESLIERGYLYRSEVRFQDKLGGYHLTLVMLTMRGHVAYCTSC